MRRLAGVLVGVSVLIGVTVAEAADRMVVKAPRKDGATRPSFYVGLHGGGGWSHTSSDTAAFATNGSGWLGGAQAGVNYQMSNVVLGLEGDFSAASIRGDASGTLGGTAVTGDARHLWFATLAGRFGIAHGRTLPYVKAGGAWTAYKWNYLSAGGATAFDSHTRSGYLVGAGVEQAVTDLISMKLEYNYMNFGNATETLSTTGGLVAAPTAVRMDVHALKLGVNLRLQSIP